MSLINLKWENEAGRLFAKIKTFKATPHRKIRCEISVGYGKISVWINK
jgi:hypothetical protein